MSATKLLAQLTADSARVYPVTRTVRMDGELPEVDRTYLTMEATPEALRYLAALFTEMAESAESSNDPSKGHSVIIDPNDLNPLTMSDWSAIEVTCRRKL